MSVQFVLPLRGPFDIDGGPTRQFNLSKSAAPSADVGGTTASPLEEAAFRHTSSSPIPSLPSGRGVRSPYIKSPLPSPAPPTEARHSWRTRPRPVSAATQ